jgi:hypothetical protein
MGPCINKFAQDSKVTDHMLRNFLGSIRWGYASDPHNHDNTVHLTVSYEDKKKSTRTYDELVNYGYISIPVDMLNSSEEEDKWLKLNVQKLIEGLHQIVLKSKVFELLCKKLSARKSFVNIIFDRKKKANLPDYLESCAISVKPIKNLTHLLIQEDANRIVDYLYQHRLPQQKYKSSTRKNTADDGDASDDDGDTSD